MRFSLGWSAFASETYYKHSGLRNAMSECAYLGGLERIC